MKKQITIEQTFCDVCGKAAGFNTCLKCGKEFCYDCREVHSVEYSHAVHSTGSGDGLYCNECDSKCSSDGDSVHYAYAKIKALRDEAAGWQADFSKRADIAERQLKELSS